MLKAGFSGSGFISHYHAEGLKSCRSVELRSVASPTLANAESFAVKHRVSGKAYTDFSQMLRDSDVDFVVLSTPNVHHHPQTLEALETGRHVFVEKPMACSAAQAEEMLNLAEKKNLALMTGHVWRFDGEANFLADEIRSGKIGDVFKASGYGIHVNWGPGGWFTRKKLAWGGALADMGIHAVDTLRYLMGDPAPVQVFAKVRNAVKQMEVEDSALLLIEWDNGVCSIVESGWWHPYMQGPEAAARIYGTTGYASLYPTFVSVSGPEGSGPETALRTEGSFPERNEHCGQEMYSAQMREFINAIENGRRPLPGGLEGLVNMKIIEAAYRSSDTGRPMAIDA